MKSFNSGNLKLLRKYKSWGILQLMHYRILEITLKLCLYNYYIIMFYFAIY